MCYAWVKGINGAWWLNQIACSGAPEPRLTPRPHLHILAYMQTLTTQEVANLAGIHKDTLLRWLRKGWVNEPGRDLRNWRVFTYEQAVAVQDFAGQVSEPQPEYNSDSAVEQLSLLSNSVTGSTQIDRARRHDDAMNSESFESRAEASGSGGDE